MPNNQIEKGYDFSTGQLVTADNLDALAQEATLKKGAISEQPDMAAIKAGTYDYVPASTGISLTINSPAHGFGAGDRIVANFISSAGAPGSDFSGVYEISSITSADDFVVTLPSVINPSSGDVSMNLVPSGEDEILIHDVSDTDQQKPKRVALSEIFASTEVGVFGDVVTNDISAKTYEGVNVYPKNGVTFTDATYSSIDGYTVTVTKANHGLVSGDVVAVVCTATSGTNGSAYSGIFLIEAGATVNTFTYNLRDEAFITVQENEPGEYDQPLPSQGNASYQKVGTLTVDGNVLVSQDVFFNGTTYMRGDTFTYGRAKFGELVLPKGRTLTRPANPEEGQLFYNRDDDIVEIFRKSVGFPAGSWETFDKVSNQIIIPASYSTRTRIAETAATWYSKTLWTMPTPVRYKQYEITLPPIRLQHFNQGNDQAMYGKLELIAKEDVTPELANEYVIARYVNGVPNHTPWEVFTNQIVTIPKDNRIITPDDIDMSNMRLTLRVSVFQAQAPDADNPAVQNFNDSEWILPWIGYVRINPLVRKGGTPIPTFWKKETQINSLSNITDAQRAPMRWWTRYISNFNQLPMNTAYPANMPAPIPLINVVNGSASHATGTYYDRAFVSPL